jgi:hypothetical protein
MNDLAADYDKLCRPSVDQGQWEKTTIKWPAALGAEPTSTSFGLPTEEHNPLTH